jgi:hypothetical protein
VQASIGSQIRHYWQRNRLKITEIMSNYQDTEVYKYLEYLEHYLSGDLDKFHNICDDAEIMENLPIVTVSNTGSMSPGKHITASSSSITSEGAKAPNENSSASYVPSSKRQDFFRLTIPTTLTLFAVVDFVGYLSGANNDFTNTNKNFKEFFKQSAISVSDADSEFLNWLFRQGLTHLYFPKLGLSISYHSKNPVEKLFFKNNGNLVLNVKRLEAIVMGTFKSITQNYGLYSQMESRHQSVKSDYEGKYQTLIESYLALV